MKRYRSNDSYVRCRELARYLIDNKTTVRNTAAHFGISKSTVHKDISEKLKRIDNVMYNEAKEILEINKSERHIRGGMATRQKYVDLKCVSNLDTSTEKC